MFTDWGRSLPSDGSARFALGRHFRETTEVLENAGKILHLEGSVWQQSLAWDARQPETPEARLSLRRSRGRDQ